MSRIQVVIGNFETGPSEVDVTGDDDGEVEILVFDWANLEYEYQDYEEEDWDPLFVRARSIKNPDIRDRYTFYVQDHYELWKSWREEFGE